MAIGVACGVAWLATSSAAAGPPASDPPITVPLNASVQSAPTDPPITVPLNASVNAPAKPNGNGGQEPGPPTSMSAEQSQILAEAGHWVDDAVDALRAERDLVGQGGGGTQPPPDLRERIKHADDRGVNVLNHLVEMGYEPSYSVSLTLGPLPRPTIPGPPLPTRQDYDQAIRDLGRNPGPGGAPTPANGSSWSPTMVALLVAVGVASALLAVLLVVVLRRKKDTRLVELANTDSLTGLYNRRRLDDDLVMCSAKQRGPVGVLMVDVDNFKVFNDTQGHSAGDRILQLVGAVLAHQVRSKDVVYRYGGEEFCVLLPNTTQVEAARVAERIRAATAQLRMGGTSGITVSVGVAVGAAAEVMQTLDRADAAMYNAKRDGRDRVAVAMSA